MVLLTESPSAATKRHLGIHNTWSRIRIAKMKKQNVLST